MPYWDWTKNVDSWWRANIFSSDYFGLNRNPNGRGHASGAQCVSTGT